jgi:hypothetical protein
MRLRIDTFPQWGRLQCGGDLSGIVCVLPLKVINPSLSHTRLDFVNPPSPTERAIMWWELFYSRLNHTRHDFVMPPSPDGEGYNKVIIKYGIK